MDLNQGDDEGVSASSTSTKRSSEEDSAVAQLLEMAQTYGTVGDPDDTGDKNDDDAESDKEPDDVEEEAADNAEGERRADEQPEKDPYEMSGKEAEFKCHCKYFKKSPCYTRYEKQELLAYRGQYKALNKKELDIAILSKIQTGMHLSPMTCEKKKCHRERKKVRSDHYFHGDKICRDTFCFIHRISHNKLSVLMAHYRGSGICVRIMKREAEKAEKQKALASLPKKAKRPAKGKGKTGAQKPRKRKPKTAVAKQGNNNKRQRQNDTVVNNDNAEVAGVVVARHIEAMQQFVDIPIGHMSRLADNKRYMEVARLPEMSQQGHQQHLMQQQQAATADMGNNRPDTGAAQSVQAQHHHGVWHLPRRPDMQHAEGPYLLPL